MADDVLKSTFTLLMMLALVPVALSDEVSFTRDIQPILAEHCLQCHGYDADRREADLRLDDETSAKSSAIVTGDAEGSPLVERITSSDPDLRMPPDSADPLSEQQIQLIRQWIDAGADYEQHWSFQPIEDPAPPEVGESLSDIDRFIVSKLNDHQLTLSKPATKQQLLRRATFDLTGLPPTWEEVTAFLNDDSPQAFAKVVDRLLESPAYGERWGRHWLDIARYADTHGGAAIGFQRFPFSYTYRDYIIKAFNADLPYDRFVTEQLAADQLGLPDDAEQLAAIGFLTVGMQFRSRHDTIDDQIDVVTRGLMGLTVTCARCHDHKFDAIPTKDYYSLYAAFASSDAPEQLPLVGQPAASEEFEDYRAELKRRQISYEDMARDQNQVMRARLRMQVGPYLAEIAKGAPEIDLTKTDIFSYRTDDIRPPVLELWRRYLKQMPPDDAVFGPWVQLSQIDADEFQSKCQELVAQMIQENGDNTSELQRLGTEAPRWNPRVLDAISSKQPTSMIDLAAAYGELFIDVQREWLTAQLESALEAVPGNEPVPDEDIQHLTVNSAVNRQLRRHLYGPDSPTNMDDNEAIKLLNRPIHDNVYGRKGAIEDLNLNSPGSPARAMVLYESPASSEYFVFRRGNPVDRGAPVHARFLTALGGSDHEVFQPGQRRLSLAKAIIDPQNPLTRRVIVNWVWQHHFGNGLVRTPDDFGTRGELPTHPELLDYLASRLLEDGWSLKSLHRRIMLTKVYQQASIERPTARAVDPDNRLLWRMPRKRLELEAMRDAMLWVSQELQPDQGGRPFELLAQPAVPRRSVYAFINRDIVAPLLSAFDAANPNACTARRPDTMVPHQTLFALNSDFIQDRANVFASNAVGANLTEIDSAAVVRRLYRRAFSRDPDADELEVAIQFVTSQPDSGGVEPWQRLAHVLLAANEFVFVD